MSMALDLDGDNQAIIGEANVGREGRFDFGVADLVRHVGEPGASRSDFFDPGDGLLDVSVAGVGPEAQGVDDDELDALEKRKAGVRDGAHVGEVGGVADAIAPVRIWPWRSGMRWKRAPKISTRHAGLPLSRFSLTRAREFDTVDLREGVVEDTFEDLGRGVVGIERELLCSLES